MKLYWITWTTEGGFGLNAVVAAGSEEAAVAELDLSSFETLEGVEEVGTARAGRFSRPEILSRETL